MILKRKARSFLQSIRDRLSLLFLTSFLVVPFFLEAQNLEDSSFAQAQSNIHPVNKGRLALVAGTQAALMAGSYIALNQAWYDNYEKESFHTFNDWEEWLQMDKMGHMWTTYQLSRYSTSLWKYAGIKPSTSVWLGGTSAMLYQSIIEIQDGFSAKWGFSWYDMAANALGAGLFIGQELGWKEQRIQVKFGYWSYNYPSDLTYRRDELFGTSQIERLLKDYNSQTYWISANMHSFLPQSKIPKWLNISFGYSADLMLGGTENIWEDESGNTVDRSDIPRVRRFYLSPDIDLTKIPTRKKWLKTTFYIFNMIKVPLPALEYSSQGKFSWHWLHQ
jgi:Predicted periplasmic lipoprotein (DUF2279)